MIRKIMTITLLPLEINSLKNSLVLGVKRVSILIAKALASILKQTRTIHRTAKMREWLSLMEKWLYD